MDKLVLQQFEERLQQQIDALPKEQKEEFFRKQRTALEAMERALRPGTTTGDLFILYRESRGNPDKLPKTLHDPEAALDRIVSKMKTGLKNPKARNALLQLTRNWNERKQDSDKETPLDFLKHWLFPAAIKLVIQSLSEGKKSRIRIGSRWVTGAQGKIIEVNPSWQLGIHSLAKYVLQEAYKNAADTVIEHFEQTLRGKDLSINDQASPSTIDLLILAADEELTSRDLERADIFAIATPRERRFILLAEAGRQRSEISNEMKIADNNLRQLIYRLREKIRKLPSCRSFRLN